MLYSVDIETTGLDPYKHAITEIGIVEIDPVEKITRRGWSVHFKLPEDTIWSEFCLTPERVSRATDNRERMTYEQFHQMFLREVGKKQLAVGKNAGQFDLKFIEAQIGKDLFDFRALDVGQMYWKPGMPKVPSLKGCMEIAKSEGCHLFNECAVSHTGYQDALDTANLFLWRLK